MKARIILAASTLGTLLSTSAFAEAGSLGAAAPTSRISAQAQVEMLPVGSAKSDFAGLFLDAISIDTRVAYGVTAMFDYAINPYLSIGVAPRLVLNVGVEGAEETGQEIDLRARIVGRYPVAPALQIYASVSPGYTLLTAPTGSGNEVSDPRGFAIAGAVGLTYDLSPRLFLSGEAGYQRAFTTTDGMAPTGEKASFDTEVSYMHVGLGAGTRF